jgi:uncharacterized protein with PQ loop repeat
VNILIGLLAGFLLAGYGVPQAFKVVKQGHADGLSLQMMLMLMFGLFFMGLYIWLEHGFDILIHGEYAISIGVWAVSLWYYFFPRVAK